MAMVVCVTPRAQQYSSAVIRYAPRRDIYEVLYIVQVLFAGTAVIAEHPCQRFPVAVTAA